MAKARGKDALSADSLSLPAPELGRPRAQLVSLRFRPGLRDRCWAQATAEGRSLNDEINVLVERGLEADRPLADTFGSTAGFAVARALLAAAEAAVAGRGADQGVWLRDSGAFDEAAAAITAMLETLRPGPLQEARAAVEQARRPRGQR